MDDNSSAFFSTSNRMFLQCLGKGNFSMERFEQIKPGLQEWQKDSDEVTQSRMVYNLSEGLLLLDSRNMAEASECIIEVPMGRIILKRALIGVEFTFNPESKTSNFIIICEAGNAKFAQRHGETYSLQAGQRLHGIRVRMSVSTGLEVTEITEDWLERLQSFKTILERYRESADALQAYQPYFKPIHRSDLNSRLSTQTEKEDALKRYPRFIESAGYPDHVTPFRGEIRPPKPDEADLF